MCIKLGKSTGKYINCITDDIVSDEVIITYVQIKHIQERHPNDYEGKRTPSKKVSLHCSMTACIRGANITYIRERLPMTK